MKRIGKYIKDLLFVLLVVTMCVLIVAISRGYRPKVAGYQLLRVLTYSMSPAIEENSLIIIKEVPQENIQVGDIITFVSEDPDLKGLYNTHRVHSIQTDAETGEKQYITKGDKNTYIDVYPVHYSQVAGKYLYSIPFGHVVGQAIAALADQRVYFIFIMLPLMLCFLSYMWQIIALLTSKE